VGGGGEKRLVGFDFVRVARFEGSACSTRDRLTPTAVSTVGTEWFSFAHVSGLSNSCYCFQTKPRNGYGSPLGFFKILWR